MKKIILLVFLLSLSGCSFFSNLQANIEKSNQRRGEFLNSCEAERQRCFSAWQDPSCSGFLAASAGKSCVQMWNSQYNTVR